MVFLLTNGRAWYVSQLMRVEPDAYMQNWLILQFQKNWHTKFPWGRLGASPTPFLAVGRSPPWSQGVGASDCQVDIVRCISEWMRTCDKKVPIRRCIKANETDWLADYVTDWLDFSPEICCVRPSAGAFPSAIRNAFDHLRRHAVSSSLTPPVTVVRRPASAASSVRSSRCLSITVSVFPVAVIPSTTRRRICKHEVGVRIECRGLWYLRSRCHDVERCYDVRPSPIDGKQLKVNLTEIMLLQELQHHHCQHHQSSCTH